jgi:hypothetical protein
MQLDDINTDRCENKPYSFHYIIVHQKKKKFIFYFISNFSFNCHCANGRQRKAQKCDQ